MPAPGGFAAGHDRTRGGHNEKHARATAIDPRARRVCLRHPIHCRPMWDPAYIGAGFGVGVLVGLTGIGGGSMMTPILVLLFGQPPSMAVGTDLIFASATKLVATAWHGLRGRVDWTVLGRLALGSLPTALATLAWLASHQRAPVSVDRITLTALGAMLLLSSAGLVVQIRIARLGFHLEAPLIERLQRWQPLTTVITGVGLGLAVTLTSVGAGALGTVVLVFLYPLRLTPVRLVATDIAHALPLTLVAGLGHAALGHLNLTLLANLLLGSIPGVLIATRTAVRAPDWLIRTLVAFMLALTGIRLLIG
jgi:uncharacterized protein